MEWKKALQNLEETPPTHCWSEIKESLIEDIPEIRSKLYDYTEAAPEEAQHIILSRIGNPKKGKLISLSRSRSVAAASIIVLMSLSVLYIISTPDIKPKVGTVVIQSTEKKETTAGNYILHTNQNGEQIKVSSKLLPILPSGSKKNDSLIKNWQKKLGTSAYIPTGNNFFDIAEMIQFLEEEDKKN